MRAPTLVLMLLMLSAPAAASDRQFVPPKAGAIPVAFVVTDGANVMDLAGAWEVFQDTMVEGRDTMPFQLYIVSDSKKPIRLTGGMTLVPQYTFTDAPKADIVSVGAQRGAPGLSGYLRKQYASDAVIMSVCTGAFKVADAGLFDGKRATTHHDYFDAFRKKYPKVTLVPGNRYVQSGERLFSAGGLTSGVDLALHVVELYYGRAVAQRTANYMEYTGTGWKKPEGGSPLTD